VPNEEQRSNPKTEESPLIGRVDKSTDKTCDDAEFAKEDEEEHAGDVDSCGEKEHEEQERDVDELEAGRGGK